jgi:copper chaperone CopZ
MSNPTNPENAALSELMVARLEIEQLGDATSEKQITDAVTALNGVKDVKVENEALFVTYDPLNTTEKKIEAAVRSSGGAVKAAGTDTEGTSSAALTSGYNRNETTRQPTTGPKRKK